MTDSITFHRHCESGPTHDCLLDRRWVTPKGTAPIEDDQVFPLIRAMMHTIRITQLERINRGRKESVALDRLLAFFDHETLVASNSINTWFREGPGSIQLIWDTFCEWRGWVDIAEAIVYHDRASSEFALAKWVESVEETD